MLRVDSFEFVVIALVIVVLLRTLPRTVAKIAYALSSSTVYVWLLPNPLSIALSAAFVLWPWFFLRFFRERPAWSVPFLIVVQVGALLWVREYFALIPTFAVTPLIAHAVVIVGVSYIILRQVELVLLVDAEPETEVGLVDYLAFTIGMFTLLAGPIIPYQDFQAGFLFERERESSRSLALALNRIVNGYLKVSLVSPLLFDLSSMEMLRTTDASLGGRLLFFYLYPLYIYFNFSGYCDVVIGLGGLARFEIPENFDHPYLATNIQNYWQRWHLTFSHWIRDHLFFPLARTFRESRLPLVRAVGIPVAILVTFLLVGLWHGTNLGFAIFGVLHGVAILAVAPYGRFLDRVLRPDLRALYESNVAIRGLRIAACYNYLCFTMLFFERPYSRALDLFR